MASFPRVQSVVLPLLRAAPALSGVTISSWVAAIDYRTFPLINVKRIGGARNGRYPALYGLPVVEMTAYGTEGLVETETLYDDALEALYDAVTEQTQVPGVGYLHSIKETMGATEFDSPFQDSWRIQGLIQLGVRTPRTT